jgi:hypothetical protein
LRSPPHDPCDPGEDVDDSFGPFVIFILFILDLLALWAKQTFAHEHPYFDLNAFFVTLITGAALRLV